MDSARNNVYHMQRIMVKYMYIYMYKSPSFTVWSINSTHMAGQAQKPFSKLKHIKYDYGQQDRELIVFIWDLEEPNNKNLM